MRSESKTSELLNSSSILGGLKPMYLKDYDHTVMNPALDADDSDAALTSLLEWKYGFAGIGSHCCKGTPEAQPARLVV